MPQRKRASEVQILKQQIKKAEAEQMPALQEQLFFCELARSSEKFNRFRKFAAQRMKKAAVFLIYWNG